MPILKLILTFYILYALFDVFIFRDQATKMEGLRTVHASEAYVISMFDDVALMLAALMVILQFLSGIEYLNFITGMIVGSGIEYLNFITGMIVGMTVIQVFFHRFRDPLPVDKIPASSYRVETDVVLDPDRASQGLA
jgi:hypothetical protein